MPLQCACADSSSLKWYFFVFFFGVFLCVFRLKLLIAIIVMSLRCKKKHGVVIIIIINVIVVIISFSTVHLYRLNSTVLEYNSRKISAHQLFNGTFVITYKTNNKIVKNPKSTLCEVFV